MTVVLSAILNDLLWCIQTKQQEPRKSDTGSEVKHRHGNSAASLERARQLYICANKKHPFTSHPTAKRPKHCKFAITDM